MTTTATREENPFDALCGDNQYELARRLDVTNRAPGNWLHGRHRPSKQYMQRMQEMADYE